MAKTKQKKRAKKSGGVLRDSWSATLEAVAAAEAGIERQVGLLLKKNRINRAEASALLAGLGERVKRERKRALKELESRLQGIQARVKRERKALGRMVKDAVQGTLAGFNIPSREEVNDLTHKVAELSRKIDGLKRRA